MDNFFRLIPDEIILQIFQYLIIPSDLLKLCQLPGLLHHFNWGFWRKKSCQIWKVSEWYFDLPFKQGRKISGKNRFVELASSFQIIPESVARIENKKVEGIYRQCYAEYLIIQKGDLFSAELFDLYDGRARLNYQLNLFGLSHISNSDIGLDTKQEKKLLKFNEKLTPLIQNKDIGKIEKKLSENTFLTACSLVVIGEKWSFEMVKRVFLNLRAINRLAIVCFSMRSGNFGQFVSLLSQSIISFCDQRTLLEKAYYLADQPYITFLEAGGIEISSLNKILRLNEGYVNFSRPVQVYQILRRLVKEEYIDDELVKNLEVDADFFLLLNDWKDKKVLLRKMKNAVQRADTSTGLLQHCISVLKREGEIEVSKPFPLLHDYGVKREIFREFGIETKTKTSFSRSLFFSPEK